MDVKKLTRSIFAALLLSGMCLTAQATTCPLGNTCTVPNSLSDTFTLQFNRASGTSYMCTVTSASPHESVKFSVTGGKDFVIDHGNGYYKARPSVTFLVEGHFKHTCPCAQGEINITAFSGKGTVSCQPYAEAQKK